MRDIDDIRHFIDSLREMGFRFALDDFGTGFTSFRYLKVLNVDIVKIDGEYIKDLVTDADDRLFVKSMVQLCEGLGIETIGEFVETKEVLAVMKELGVGQGRGWLFAKPCRTCASWPRITAARPWMILRMRCRCWKWRREYAEGVEDGVEIHQARQRVRRKRPKDRRRPKVRRRPFPATT